ncbi:DUF523 domain-containing protein [uncultured Hoeflea sp.]|uniref:DUF523 domain-containing protein n=1 Tax=uncultured Hoeflea sp. TaxID=538666 RepID=UPI0030EBB770|tara:strand:- start:28581 stop:29081 length:501 start_codon:yes stop_codon:yes gene_type:complete
MDKILVSACLLGSPVRYNGSDRLVEHSLIALWREQGRIVPLCPEVAAGFPTPRPPAEIEPGLLGDDVLAGKARIFEDTGEDVTGTFRLGAEIALKTALSQGCRFALLTDGSPSCGTSFVYSGRFDGVARAGSGVVAEILSQNGIEVFSESRIGELAEALDKRSRAL